MFLLQMHIANDMHKINTKYLKVHSLVIQTIWIIRENKIKKKKE